jgi:hypothetical protein
MFPAIEMAMGEMVEAPADSARRDAPYPLCPKADKKGCPAL